MTGAQDLARVVAGLRLEPTVQERLIAVVAHVLAAGVAAADRQDVSAFRRLVHAGDGPATVLGERHGADAPTAALLNGSLVAAEQRQDGHRRARGHPGSHVVVAVFAAAEAAGVDDGERFLTALLVGYEVGVRVGLAMGGTPPGVHDLATWDTVGAAAGVAALHHRADAGVLSSAIDLAATAPVQPSAAAVFGGATGSHLLLGIGASAGTVWGIAAAAGMTAPAGALEQHFLRRSGHEPDLSPLTAPLDAPAVLGGYLKRQPTCAHLHGVQDVVEHPLANTSVAPDDVEHVDVAVYREAAAFADPSPPNESAARFSIPFAVAATLVVGGYDRAPIGELLANPVVRRLCHRVAVRHDLRLDAGYPDGRPARHAATSRRRRAHARVPSAAGGWAGRAVRPAGPPHAAAPARAGTRRYRGKRRPGCCRRSATRRAAAVDFCAAAVAVSHQVVGVTGARLRPTQATWRSPRPRRVPADDIRPPRVR